MDSLFIYMPLQVQNKNTEYTPYSTTSLPRTIYLSTVLRTLDESQLSVQLSSASSAVSQPLYSFFLSIFSCLPVLISLHFLQAGVFF